MKTKTSHTKTHKCNSECERTEDALKVMGGRPSYIVDSLNKLPGFWTIEHSAHVVRAVNSHEALVSAIKIAIKSMKEDGYKWMYVIEGLEDALALAEGK